MTSPEVAQAGAAAVVARGAALALEEAMASVPAMRRHAAATASEDRLAVGVSFSGKVGCMARNLRSGCLGAQVMLGS